MPAAPGEVGAAAQVPVGLTEPALEGGDIAKRSERLDQRRPVAALLGLLADVQGEGAVAGQVAGAVPDPAQLVEREQGQVSVPLGREQLLGPLTRRCCIGRLAGPDRQEARQAELDDPLPEPVAGGGELPLDPPHDGDGGRRAVLDQMVDDPFRPPGHGLEYIEPALVVRVQ